MLHPRVRLASLSLLAGSLLFSLGGCRDRGASEFAKAEAQYVRLIEQGRPAEDPGFTEVLALLEKVPEDSPFSKRARRLEHAIKQARTVRPPLPLATGGHGADGGIEALMDGCEDLARRMGESQYEQERRELQQRVLKCRETVYRLREQAHHDAEPGDEGGHTR